MNIVTNIQEWQAIRKQLTLTEQTIGFIPTMGNLHQGHMSLCEHAQSKNNLTVVSIFVNPTQFNQSSDFEKYPRTFEKDKILLEKNNVDYLLLFTKEMLYPDDYQVQVHETILSQILEGEFRPGHFTGMLTIVLKLLNLVYPHYAYFGKKDYQQLLLIKKMVNALFLPIDIIACETIRAEDQLALSSRNSRLTPAERKKAALLPNLLQSSLSLEEIKKQLTAAEFKIEYVEEKWGRRLAAVWLGDVRLIDNVPY